MKNYVKTLFLCRTPLQARICLGIIDKHSYKEYDILYFTQNDSDSDRQYYHRLRLNARNAAYIYVKQKKIDILNHLFGIWFLQKKNIINAGYGHIYIASIDSFVFRYVITKNPNAILYGFDDGIANITPGDIYENLNRYKKAIFYSRLLGLPPPENIKQKIVHHFSIYPSFKNIYEANKISFIDIFSGHDNPKKNKHGTVLTFFIGQPFHEYMSNSHIYALKKWLQRQSIDFYVPHPREKAPLIDNTILNKAGELAEDAILKAAGNSRPRLLSAYSSVLFNIGSDHADLIYLSFGNDESERKRIELINKTGASIIKIA